MNLNKVTLIGRLGSDPKIYTFESGKIARVSLAVSEKYKKDGSQVESTEWFNIVCFGKLADILEKYAKKGLLVYFDGKLTTRKYEQSGVEKITVEIIAANFKMLEFPKQQDEKQPEPNEPESPDDDSDEDLPF